MYQTERALLEQGFSAVCGVDEAGCGPLAGPVYAAAVILRREDPIEGLNDSKKLSEKRREALFPQITRRAAAWSVAFATAEEIDRLNILQARLLAMRRAVKELELPPDFALVDGNRDPKFAGIPTRLVVGGDGTCACIAAASILAKVSRDREMLRLDQLYPQYGFAKHKGYPTRQHREAVLAFGPCDIHRKTFLKKLLPEEAQ